MYEIEQNLLGTSWSQVPLLHRTRFPYCTLTVVRKEAQLHLDRYVMLSHALLDGTLEWNPSLAWFFL